MPLLLLDSDIEENDAAARQVTDRLYGGGAEHRLQQELLLGVGGVRAIRAYCALTGAPAPEVFHTNEGHAGFLGVERIRELVERARADFDEALQAVRAGTVFTTHTPVPAGIDRFPRELVATHLAGMAGLPVERILELGAEEDPGLFNMAHMGLRLGAARQRRLAAARRGEPGDVRRPVAGLRRCRGADHLGHQRRARADLDGARDPGDRRARGRVDGGGAAGSGWDAIDKVSDAELWRVRGDAARAAGRARSAAGCTTRALQRGMSGAELGWTAAAFDPDVLTIGFARRVPSYKRLTLMLRDPERLRELLLDPERPVQIVDRRQEPPGRRRRQAADRPDGALRRRPGGAAPHRVPARLRHRLWRATCTGASTSG